VVPAGATVELTLPATCGGIVSHPALSLNGDSDTVIRHLNFARRASSGWIVCFWRFDVSWSLSCRWRISLTVSPLHRIPAGMRALTS